MKLGPGLLGIVFLLTGLIFFILAWGVLRILRKRHSVNWHTTRQRLVSSQGHHYVILVVAAGGRVDYINPAGRQWFDLGDEDDPDLEALARHIHPTEEFLKICAAEGQARFSVNNRPVDGVSYQVPGTDQLMLVSMSRSDAPSEISSGSNEISSSIMQILTGFSQSVAAEMGLLATIQVILENVERLTPADFLEIKIWDSDQKVLSPFHFRAGATDERQLENSLPEPPVGCSASLVENRQPLFIPDTQKDRETPLPAGIDSTRFHSYIGIPLTAGHELVGTLEVGLTSTETFTHKDLEILLLVAGQAAAAIHNAVVLEAEQRRAAELSGLANLAQALGSARDSRDLFTNLVQCIAPLFDVEILGFLVYNENRRSLEAQVPFAGMPAQVVELYHVPLVSGSETEQRFLNRELLTTKNAMEDALWHDLGIQDYAQAASWQDTALVPLVSSGHSLGYLQVSNHRNQENAFSPDEIRLLNIVANQVAPIIDNVMLVQQVRQRAQRSEALRRIASLVASTATSDEMLRYSVQELAHLMQADAAGIFLLDETSGNLCLHKSSMYGISAETADPISRLFVKDAQLHFTITGSLKPFLSGDLSEDQRLLELYRPVVEALGIQSAMIIPLAAHERGLGELLLGSQKADFFNTYDLQVASTAASQLAAAIEGAALGTQTDENLRQRVEQLTTLSRITREMNAITEAPALLRLVYDECLRMTRADCGTVFFFNHVMGFPEELDSVLRVGDTPDASFLTVERDSLERGESIIFEDVATGPYQPCHAGVQSELVVPMMYQENAIGLIHLHSSSPSRFDKAALDLVQMLAAQAAISLDNARRFRDQSHRNVLLTRSTQTIKPLFETISGLGIGQSLEQSLETLARGITKATPFRIVLMSVVESETMMQRRVTGVGIPAETLNMLMARQQPWSALVQLLRDEFKIGRGYFIPYDRRPVVSDDVELVTIAQDKVINGQNAWNPEDALIYPLADSEGHPIGLISLDAPGDGLRPDSTTLETLEIFAAQTALVIQSSRRISSFHGQVETLRTSLDRQQQLLSIGQSQLPNLLHKDMEQMISIHSLDQRARRIRAGLEITETINSQVDGPSALQALGREMLTRLEMTISIVAENGADGPRLLHMFGDIPKGTSPEALFGQRNPLRTCLQTGESLLVMNLEQDDTWRDTPLLTNLHAKGFVCLPILIDGKPLAGILAISAEPLPLLTEEDRQTYLQISRQVSIILQNISLLTETRRRLREVNLLLDFSRRLTGLGPDSIVKALLESARRVVTAAHAGVVLLYDEQEDILLPRIADGYADVDSLMQITHRPGESLPGRTFSEKKPRRVDEVNFTRDYNLPAEHLVLYREATAGRMPVSSLVVPIQTGEQALGVMVLDNFNSSGAFTSDDEALLLSLTQQVALSLENVRLAQASQERATQLQALTSVSAAMTSSLQSGELVAGLLDRLGNVEVYDTAILWLREGNRMTVASARGFSDNEQRIGLTVNISDSTLLAEMNRTSKGITVGDVRDDPRFPALVEAERLSWMGVPLVSKGEVAGVIALEKTEPNYFSLEAEQITATFASQAAVALENARLYEDSLRRAGELDQRSQRLAMLNRLSSELGSSLNEDQVLRITAQELQRTLAADRVSMVTFDRTGQPFLQLVVPFTDKSQPKPLPAAPIFDRLRESLGVFSTEQPENELDLEPLSALLSGTRSLLTLPLASGQTLHSLALIHMENTHHFTAADIDLSRTISNQAAVALESARLYQDTVSHAEQLTTINRASYEIGLSLEPEQIYAAIHRAAAELMPVESFVIALLAENEKEIDGVYLMDPGGRSPALHLSLGEGLSGQVIESGEPRLIQDVQKEPSFDGRTFGEGQPRSIIAVPITIGGKTVGMLSAQSYKPDTYSEDELQILGTLANQAAVAIQNGRLFAETRRLADELEQRVVERTAALAREQRNTETLLRILTEAVSSLDLDRALNRTLALLNDAIGAEQGSILLVNPEDNSIQYRAGYGYLTPVMTEGGRPTALRPGEGLAGWVIENREAVHIDDLHKDKRWLKMAMSASTHHSAIAAPLMVGEEVIGAIMVFHRQAGYFTPDQTSLVQAIGNQVAAAINNAQLYSLIRDQAERLGSMLRNQQVEASRQQAILEAVADGVLVTDPGNVITFLNSSLEQILMLQDRQLLGQSLDGFVGMFGKAARAWMQTIHTWSEDPTSHQPGDTYAEQLTLENGRVVLVHLAPVIWRNEFLGTVSIFRDITHEVEVDRLKSEFVATVSHELRTPMTSIKGYVDILLMGAAGALNENQQHFLDIVRSNTERLSVLVNDLLDISRIEAGRVSLSLEAIDLQEVADDVLTYVRRRSQEENKPMELYLEKTPDLPRITGDLERVRQILSNLVDNAYHYTPENGRIIIHMQPADGMVQVDVQDTGIGIDQVDADRIFERFFRGEHPLVLSTPGTGLGLAIVKQLVTMHKGKIWMTSRGLPGEGSKFSFTLPIYKPEEQV